MEVNHCSLTNIV